LTTASNKLAARGREIRGRARRVLGFKAVLGGAALLTGIGGYLCYRPAVLEPPAVVLQEVDPAVAAVVEEASRAVHRSPRSAATWGRLGMVLLAHDFLCEANVCLSQAERLDPQEPRWPYYQGIALFLGDPDAAIPKLQRAADLCADTPDTPRLQLAEVLLGQGRYAEAADQFRHILQRDFGNPRAHLGLARVSYERDDLPHSLAHLRHCADNPFTRKAAAALLAEVEQRMGEKKAVAQHLHQAANLPDDPAWPDPFVEEIEQLKRGKQGCIARMESLLAHNRVPEALQLIREWVQDHPDSDWAWLWLGRLLVQQEQFVAAERALREAARQGPEAVETQFYLGVALYCQGKSREAALFFRRATQLKPDYALAHYNLGHCLIQQGDRTAALGAFRMAVRYKVNFADAHTNLGDLLIQNGQYDEGLVHARHAIALNPGDSRAKQLLGQVFNHAAGCIGP
jgi:tetratricopeptide (TPR) repeat protein